MKTKTKRSIHFVVDNLIKIRNSKRLNQAGFAELVDIDPSIYNKIESGQLKLSLEKISQIAEKLQMRDIDIFTYPEVYVEVNKINSDIRAQLTIELKEDLKQQVLELVFGNKNVELLNK
jgi:transcriptional regulator with XRE-family HTH domain